METKRLAGLEPAAVFHYFEEICAIPHGSRNTKKISDYLVNFAKEHGLRYIQDAANNVILFGNGTCGMEDHAPVILQGHMDMVCEKDMDCPLDMEKEGLDVTHDDKFVFAKGTTLGGTMALPLPTLWRCWRTTPFPIRRWRSSSPWTRRSGCWARMSSTCPN